MSKITLDGTPVNTIGKLPAYGSKAHDFVLVGNNLSEVSIEAFKGKRIVLNIFPSIDTGVCSTSVRTFNKQISEYPNAVVLCISKDLPFAFYRFCGAEGIKNAITLSAFRNDTFGKTYGVEMIDGGFKGLYARSVVVINENGEVVYSELVPEIGQEPNYSNALNSL